MSVAAAVVEGAVLVQVANEPQYVKVGSMIACHVTLSLGCCKSIITRCDAAACHLGGLQFSSACPSCYNMTVTFVTDCNAAAGNLGGL